MYKSVFVVMRLLCFYSEIALRTLAILSTDSPVRMVRWSPFTVTISTLDETTCNKCNKIKQLANQKFKRKFLCC